MGSVKTSRTGLFLILLLATGVYQLPVQLKQLLGADGLLRDQQQVCGRQGCKTGHLVLRHELQRHAIRSAGDCQGAPSPNDSGCCVCIVGDVLADDLRVGRKPQKQRMTGVAVSGIQFQGLEVRWARARPQTWLVLLVMLGSNGQVGSSPYRGKPCCPSSSHDMCDSPLHTSYPCTNLTASTQEHAAAVCAAQPTWHRLSSWTLCLSSTRALTCF